MVVSFWENLVLSFLIIQEKIDTNQDDEDDKDNASGLERVRNGFGDLLQNPSLLTSPSAEQEIHGLVSRARVAGLDHDDLLNAKLALNQIILFRLSMTSALVHPVEEYISGIIPDSERFNDLMKACRLIMNRLKKIGESSKAFLKIELALYYGLSETDVSVLREKLFGFSDSENFSKKRDDDFLAALHRNIHNEKIPEKYRQSVLIPARFLFLALRKIEKQIKEIETNFSDYRRLTDIRLPVDAVISELVTTDPLLLSYIFYLRVNRMNPDEFKPHQMKINLGASHENFSFNVSKQMQRALYAGELDENSSILIAGAIYTFLKETGKSRTFTDEFLKAMDQKFGGRFKWYGNIRCISEMNLNEFNEWIKSMLPELPDGPLSVYLTFNLRQENQGPGRFKDVFAIAVLDEEERNVPGIPDEIKEQVKRRRKTALIRLDRDAGGAWFMKESYGFGTYSDLITRALQQNRKVHMIFKPKPEIKPAEPVQQAKPVKPAPEIAAEPTPYVSTNWNANLGNLRQYPVDDFLAWIRQNVGDATSAVLRFQIRYSKLLEEFNVRACVDEDPPSGIPERMHRNDNKMSFVRIYWDGAKRVWFTTENDKRGEDASSVIKILTESGKIEFRSYSVNSQAGNLSRGPSRSRRSSDRAERTVDPRARHYRNYRESILAKTRVI